MSFEHKYLKYKEKYFSLKNKLSKKSKKLDIMEISALTDTPTGLKQKGGVAPIQVYDYNIDEVAWSSGNHDQPGPTCPEPPCIDQMTLRDSSSMADPQFRQEIESGHVGKMSEKERQKYDKDFRRDSNPTNESMLLELDALSDTPESPTDADPEILPLEKQVLKKRSKDEIFDEVAKNKEDFDFRNTRITNMPFDNSTSGPSVARGITLNRADPLTKKQTPEVNPEKVIQTMVEKIVNSPDPSKVVASAIDEAGSQTYNQVPLQEIEEAAILANTSVSNPDILKDVETNLQANKIVNDNLGDADQIQKVIDSISEQVDSQLTSAEEMLTEMENLTNLSETSPEPDQNDQMPSLEEMNAVIQTGAIPKQMEPQDNNANVSKASEEGAQPTNQMEQTTNSGTPSSGNTKSIKNKYFKLKTPALNKDQVDLLNNGVKIVNINSKTEVDQSGGNIEFSVTELNDVFKQNGGLTINDDSSSDSESSLSSLSSLSSSSDEFEL